ncbi:hypothetical protein KV557_00230 [Kitasatospora aureofaciens]|uniref:hypothetical protein n=1 Tax=Kitasatospora aureofaciens TaxID=1894 RepID=UPI001C477EC7|nr:hypothetical protein [Kitasatospora aureofaciens]MBV6695553.1 hypothetical protein [Kitasatospora aureofaciens]
MESVVQALRGWTPRDRQTAAAVEYLAYEPELFEVVSSHHAGIDGTQQFILAFDRLTIGGPPGLHRAVAFHVDLGPLDHTCRVRQHRAPAFAWAGHWLVGQGADPRAVADYLPVPADPYNFGPHDQVEGLLFGTDYGFARPAAGPTRLIEERIRRSGDRYRILRDGPAFDACSNGEREGNYVLLHDRSARAVGRRFVIQLETIRLTTATYSITEGGFPTLRQARDWLTRIDRTTGTAPALPATDPVTGLAPPQVSAPVRPVREPHLPPTATARRGR